MTKFRRVLLAILTLIGITAVSLAGTGSVSAIVPASSVSVTASSACLPDGWRVDYTAVSVNSALPWKNMTPDWLPTINTYQANTIPFTRSTGVLPFSQATTPPISITVVWNDAGDETSASDTESQINQPDCDVAPTTTAAPTTTLPPVILTNPPTTAPVVTVPDTIVAIVADPCLIDELCFEQPSTTVAPAVVTEFPVTGKGDGGLLIGGISLGAGIIALLAARRPKHA